jgi:hypothetical protein
LNQPQTDNLFKTNNRNNNIRTDIEKKSSKQGNQILDASYVNERVPAQFTDLVICFFNDAKKIEEYWKLVTISARKNKISGDILETALQAFKSLIRKVKFSKVSNTYGYFYGVLNRNF